MNTYSRESILELKNAIKVLANNQIVLKNQRKTVHIVGERTMPTWEATWKHASARTDLRHMYIAYGIIRGKTIEQIEGKSRTEFSMPLVEQIITQYGKVVCPS